ncbi:SDR family NAD(P)-dependent oxidoreductase [Acetatifactor muris]|uniref:3-oxoacyl-[acyl-carrier-protein] reductase FabG n=1 Tax=Acetatifactor muris TaxID=879566 RepID=A0A2K4ZD07_9FIRM|nr:SDR family NAD(P)-dependent oxidoreductase [Acetatifactor muris]MCR2046738.1 SDR family NAD(P)-dependent oxidoreductase [Acetatifactor muris]SOY28330.1 3-oxoacyl-[acyl-carrier-protein] reductase FabG [Acetatifactor muris]
MSVPEKYALITGASRGIGKAAAELFSAHGYHLILTCSRSVKELETLAVELERTHGITCLPVQADMGCEADVERLFAHVHALDILVNNAGMAHFGLLSQMTSAQWHQIMAVNLDSCFYTCRAAIPLMLQKHRGRIINVSSVWGARGASMETAYSASKGGMNAFTRALAKELAPSNIQVNAVACGLIDTAMNACLSPEDMASLQEEIPAGRAGTPAEAARLIYQVAHAPEYMTGQIITLDGGWQT